MNAELKRMRDIAIGEHWIDDPKLMLFCVLTDGPAKDAYRARGGFKGIPDSYVEAAKLLYKGVGNSNAEELKTITKVNGTSDIVEYDLAAERICDACLEYLSTVLSREDLTTFKKSTPIRKLKTVMEDIRKMIEEQS